MASIPEVFDPVTTAGSVVLTVHDYPAGALRPLKWTAVAFGVLTALIPVGAWALGAPEQGIHAVTFGALLATGLGVRYTHPPSTEVHIDRDGVRIHGRRRHLDTLASVQVVERPNRRVRINKQSLRSRGLELTWTDGTTTTVWGSRHEARDLEALATHLREAAEAARLPEAEKAEIQRAKRAAEGLRSR